MIGFPWDDESTIKNTINFSIDLNPDSAQFAVVTPFPKTPLCKILNEKGIEISQDWRDYLLKGDEINYAFDLPHLPRKALKEYIDTAYYAFNNKKKLS